MITERDEGRHPAGPGELWNESYYFNFYDRRTQLGGFARIGTQANRQRSSLIFLLFKQGRPVFNRFLLDLPYTEEGMDQGITVAGLTYRVLEPLKSMEIRFEAGDTRLDLTWEALHPVAEIGAGDEKMPEQMASGHYEQAGEVAGTVTLRQGKSDFQGYGFRDHSWGIRDWEAMKHYDLAWPIFGKDLLLNCMQITLLNGHTFPMGFVFDGNENLKISRQEMEVQLDEDDLTQKKVMIRITDEKGRDWEVTGKRIAKFALPFDGFLINETMFEYRLPQGQVGYGLCERGVRL